ncbi:MAG: methyltransferase domain-containing protein [Limisphaerales bacterium]
MNESTDSTRPEFWDIRYASGKIPWDFHGVPTSLNSFLKMSSPANVLIPGCGTGYEVRAFHQAGWKVTAIDFSPVAIEQARIHLGELVRFVVLGDFFKHDFGARRFDMIYERTFLCALPPDSWLAYVNRTAQLLRPGGRLTGIFLYGEESEPPPFPLTKAKAQELFGDKFSLLRSDLVEDSLPLFVGKEHWQEWGFLQNACQPRRYAGRG